MKSNLRPKSVPTIAAAAGRFCGGSGSAPAPPTSPKEQNGVFYVNNSKKHLTKRFMFRKKGSGGVSGKRMPDCMHVKKIFP